VTGHEPNKRHWNNPDCMATVQEMNRSEARRKAVRKYFEPSRYIGKISRTLGWASAEGLEDEVNSILRGRFGFAADLTPQEVRHLVDVHVPDELEGDFKIGLDGFDWEELKPTICRVSSWFGSGRPAIWV